LIICSESDRSSFIAVKNIHSPAICYSTNSQTQLGPISIVNVEETFS